MPNTVVFVDSKVSNYQALLANLAGDREVHLLNAEEDGVLQVAAILQGRRGLDAIHILSHGSSGTLSLGSTQLNNLSLGFYRSALEQIGSSLLATGDILVYGCNVAADQTGMQFINRLAELTGADVAASNGITGAAVLGGDWDLETSTGWIEALALSSTDYSGLLANGLTIFTSQYQMTAGQNHVSPNDTVNTYFFGGNTNPSNSSGKYATATLQNGAVTVTGDANYGNNLSVGDSDFVSSGVEVVAVVAEGTFVAIKSDGTLKSWGNWAGGGISATGINEITVAMSGWAALKSDGTIVSAGAYQSDKPSSTNFVKVFAGGYGSYAALTDQGSLATWGYASDGSTLSGRIMDVAFNYGSGIALKSDGSTVTWGHPGYTQELITWNFGHTFNEDTLNTGTLSANGITDNSVSYLKTSEPSHGTVTIDLLTGVYSYTPFADYNGIDNFSYTVSNGSTQAITATVILNINAVNDAPTATNSNTAETYTEDTPLNLTAIVANDVDSANITAILTLSNTVVGSLNTATSGTTTSTYNAGVWTASGTIADVNTLLAGVIFTPANNCNGTFTLSTSISDGMATAITGSKSFTGTAVNDAPAGADSINATFTYYENGLVVLDSTVQITDTELATQDNYNGASITLARNGGANSQDEFSGGGNLSFSGSDVLLSSVIIGTISNNNGTLIITFNDNATQSQVDETLSSLTYSNTSDNPPSSVQIDWTFNDGNTGAQGAGGALTALGSTTVNITAINDAPTLTAFTSSVASDNEDSEVTVTFADLQSQGNAVDVDGTVSAFVVKALSSGTLKIGLSESTAIAWNASSNNTVDATHQAYWTPAANANGTLNAFTAVAKDAAGLESSMEVQATVTVTAVNDAPTLTVFDSVIANGDEDTEVLISMGMLQIQGDEADIDDTVTGFVVKSLTSGSLRIGPSTDTATAWDATTNNTIDATLNAYWTPDDNGNGLLDAFTAVAKDGGGLESADAIQTQITIAPVNDAPTGTVTLTGTATQGQTLTVGNTLADVDGLGAISYQWKADGEIVGSGNSYLLTQADVGKAMTVTANYTENQGNVESVNSVATAAVANINDLPTGTVTISGVVKQEELLTASNTLADADGLGTVSYVWTANNIVLGTANTQALTQAEVGKTITLTANYTDNYGAVESKTSTATAPVLNVNDLPTGEVTISGIAKQGEILTASNTLADADGLGAVSYQWKANGAVIGSGDSCTLTQAEVGKTVTAVALYIDLLGSADSKASAATTAVANINDLPGGTVTISGTVKRGEVLTASNTLADADGLGSISYQWQADGTVIGSGKTYLLTNAEVGKTITVTASYLDKGNTAETVSSPATAIVAKNFTNLTIYGDQAGSKADVLSGMNGNDNLYGKDMNDKLSGDEGNDILYGGYDNDSLYGGEGNDTLYGEQDADYLQGDSGNDTLDGGLGKDTLIGGSGNDTYYLGYDVADVINDQGSISDLDSVIMPYQLSSYTLPANIEIGTITAGSQASDLTGNELDNTLTGNNGDNALNGAVGRDSLFGGSGNDELIGGSDSDSLNGGLGNDVLDGGSGNDNLIGGAGNDTYLVDRLNDVIIESGATTASARANATATSGIDTVKSTVSWALGANLENLILAGSAANGTGNDFANTLAGNAVNNNLTGGAGMDTLLGNNGNDTLTGGAGKDILTGGSGADIFKLPALSDSGITSTSRDTIKDFKAIQGDKIDLSVIDANTATANNDAFSTIKAGGTFSGAFHNPGELYFDKNSHILYGNNDADTSADFSILLTGVSSLGARDFIL